MAGEDEAKIFTRSPRRIRRPLPARFKACNRCPIVAAHCITPALLLGSLFCLLTQTLPIAHCRCVPCTRPLVILQSACTPHLSHEPVRKRETGKSYQSP